MRVHRQHVQPVGAFNRKVRKHGHVSLELLNDLNACSDSEDNQNKLQSIKKSDSRHKCSGQNQPPPSYKNQVHSEC